MPISFNHIPSNIRVPFFYAEVDNSQAFQHQPEYRTLIIGQKLSTGIASADEIIMVQSSDLAREYFGTGSQLAKMVEAYRANDAFMELWCLPVDDNGAGAEAAGSIDFGGPATENGTINIYIGGQRVQIAVATGDTGDEIATALAAAITTELPVTAEVNGVTTSQVDFTASHKGECGNNIDIRMNYLGYVGGEKNPAGITATIVAMAGGTSNPVLTTALANIGDEKFNYIIHPFTDATTLDGLRDFMDDATGRWSYLKQIYGHVFSARVGTVSVLDTFGETRNDPHATIFGYDDSPTPPWEVAAMVGAQAGSSLSIDPARPLQTLALVGFMPPPVKSRFTTSDSNVLLNSGIATTYVEGGYVRIMRSITTYQDNAWGQPDESYLDVQTPATLSYVLTFLNGRISQKFGRHKLANDGTRFGAGQSIVTPKIVRAELIAAYSELEAKGLVENLAAFKANLIVERNADNPNRLDILFPPDLVNQLRIFAVLAQFRLQYPVAA